ncbi:MAG: tryptophan--tRNA ligase [Mesorhizobium sp.]|nr:MAG: tryptophan--tRNA ligase [Mesorhizobium sp.]
MSAFKPLVFSGVQPTGNLHLGNYLGAIKKFVALQEQSDCIYCVVDLHSLTAQLVHQDLGDQTRSITAAFLASGIDPKKHIVFNQSRVIQHAELAWIFNCVARIGWMYRMTQFKDKAGKDRENASLGLLAYPSLMAADILLYRATHVPVGEDQKQHLELTRDIAQKFNNDFSEKIAALGVGVEMQVGEETVNGYFPITEPVIGGPAARIMSLRDGSKKMSKSDPSDLSRINLTDDADTISKKIRKAKTDPEALPSEVDGLESRPEAENLVGIYAGLAEISKADVLKEYGGQQFSVFKPALADLAVEKLAPIASEMRRIEGDRAYEDVLDRLRIFASEQKFLIGVRLLAGSIDPGRAGRAFSDLADLTIEAALNAVIAEFALRHGRIAGGRVALLGMGKLGSRELTAGSDVDLILLYDHDADAEDSDGEKPLAPSHYYTRITQRLIAAVSAPTAEGVLYELDLRLRPSGNKGPVATHVDAYKKYQRQDAWTWEHMALARARAIGGDAALCAEVEDEVAAVLAQPRDGAKVKADASEMRALIDTEKPPRDLWDIKLIPGGLIDLEFIAQVAVITGAVEAGRRATATAEVLARLAPGYAAPDVRQELCEAWRLYLALTQMIRLCLTGEFQRDDVPPGLSDLLLAATDLPDFGVLEAHLKETSRKIRKDFDLLLRAGASISRG